MWHLASNIKLLMKHPFTWLVTCVLTVYFSSILIQPSVSTWFLDWNSSYVSKSGVRLFPYYLLAYIMPPLYKR